MDWTQVLTIMATTVGCCIYFQKLHREDIQKMDEKLEKMDAKWERLFERLLLQDKRRKAR